ncbi:hypothetical protein B0T25DRAFT_188735 [Lasiosphaeria hispida]|uniref:Uncharacterized protein n=1 Tax=Lasiosphaeria hispida TaxID=260671 RepID=A0AAJ0HHP2_9PEZI|nr:hypothetical protein B0T25DRAFT_188735 [Lasiosphaeria hispida]
MSFAPEFHVPGAYRFDNNTTRSSQPLSAGIFRPPVSPSASSYNLTGSLYSDVSMSNTNPANAHGTAKRKRMSTRESTPVEWNMNMDGANDAREDEKKTAAGRQIQYTLAGQINATPGAVPAGAENGILEDSVYSDVDYRRALGPKDLHDEGDSPSVQLDTSGLRLDKSDGQNPGKWSSLALHTIGDVMGKVWEFCKGGGFRGFHAGGGTGYDLQEPAASSQTGKPWCNEHDIPTLPNDDPQAEPPSDNNGVPGRFPQSDFMPFSPEYHNMSTPESTPRPAAKRRQVSGNNDELKRNWVLVDDKAEQEQRPRGFGAALSKAPSRPSTATGRRSGYYAHTSASSGRRINVPISRLGSGTPSAVQRGRTSLRISQTGSPSLPQREPASFAPPRSPVRTTPSRIPIPSQSAGPSQGHNPFAFPGSGAASLSRPSSRQSRLNSPVALPRTGPVNGAPSPSPTKSIGHHRNQSSASAAPTARRATLNGRVDVDDIQASPRLTAEAKQLAQKKLAAERDADMRVDAFNARLLRMIRQGKEALGTRVEVIEDDLGSGGPVGGWEDDD